MVPRGLSTLNVGVWPGTFWSTCLWTYSYSSLTEIRPSPSRSAAPSRNPSATAAVNGDGCASSWLDSTAGSLSWANCREVEEVMTTRPLPANGSDTLTRGEPDDLRVRSALNAPL